MNGANSPERPAGWAHGPDGTALTLDNLPSPSTVRWVMRRKSEIVAAVRGGLLSLEDACERYAISMEEFLSWKRAMDDFGPAGLQATHTRADRHPAVGRAARVPRTRVPGSKVALRRDGS